MPLLSRTFAAAALLGILAAQPATAQVNPFSLELRGGLGVPTGEFAEDLNPGFGFGILGLYSILPETVQLYAGYERYAFEMPDEDDEDFGTLSGSGIAKGFRGGARLHLGAAGRVQPFAAAGLIYQSLASSVRMGGFGFSLETDRTIGFEVEGGFELDVSTNLPLRLTPAVRYRQHPMRLDAFGELAESGTISSVVFEIGLAASPR